MDILKESRILSKTLFDILQFVFNKNILLFIYKF